jgi:hypothetical protein
VQQRSAPKRGQAAAKNLAIELLGKAGNSLAFFSSPARPANDLTIAGVAAQPFHAALRELQIALALTRVANPSNAKNIRPTNHRRHRKHKTIRQRIEETAVAGQAKHRVLLAPPQSLVESLPKRERRYLSFGPAAPPPALLASQSATMG